MSDTPERRDEPEEVPNWPDSVLDDACELLGTALYWSKDNPIDEATPMMRRAQSHIDECAMDNPDELLEAVKCAWRGDHITGSVIYRGYIRTYAEANLTDLVAFFQIETKDKI